MCMTPLPLDPAIRSRLTQPRICASRACSKRVLPLLNSAAFLDAEVPAEVVAGSELIGAERQRERRRRRPCARTYLQRF